MKNSREVAEKLVYGTIEDGGITVSAGEHDVPTEGYVVGVGFGIKIPSIYGTPSILATVQSFLSGVKSSFAWFGGWHDKKTGIFYFDAVAVVEDRKLAEELGRSVGEIAIWDLSTQSEIVL